MAQKENKPNVSSNVKSASAISGNETTTTRPLGVVASPIKREEMFFHKENYILLIAGIVVIAIGFILMSGGRMKDPAVFDTKVIYSARRIVLAPIVVIIGFIVVMFAVLWKPKEN